MYVYMCARSYNWNATHRRQLHKFHIFFHTPFFTLRRIPDSDRTSFDLVIFLSGTLAAFGAFNAPAVAAKCISPRFSCGDLLFDFVGLFYFFFLAVPCHAAYFYSRRQPHRRITFFLPLQMFPTFLLFAFIFCWYFLIFCLFCWLALFCSSYKAKSFFAILHAQVMMLQFKLWSAHFVLKYKEL